MSFKALTAERTFSIAEERSHAISHGIGALAALIGGCMLVKSAMGSGDTAIVIGAAVFSLSAFVLYTCSALVHAYPPGPAKDRFELLDHMAIFLLIAGTYTPFTLGVLRGPWGWSLLSAIWVLAFLGIASKLWRGLGNTRAFPLLYVAMGWLIVIAAGPMIHRMSMNGLLLILAGGFSYTLGVVFYLTRQIPYSHLVWHLLVLAGTSFHYFAILNHAAG